MNRFTFMLATGAVAFIILMDIATGQGPPQLQSYLAGAPVQYALPPRAPVEPTVSYPPKAQYEQSKKDAKLEAITAQEYEKNLEKAGGYENAGYEKSANQPEQPSGGMFSSLGNAWRTLTSFGRRTKRGANDGKPNGPFSSGGPNGGPGAEWSQTNNQGYIYFKIPKNSICFS